MRESNETKNKQFRSKNRKEWKKKNQKICRLGSVRPRQSEIIIFHSFLCIISIHACFILWFRSFHSLRGILHANWKRNITKWMKIIIIIIEAIFSWQNWETSKFVAAAENAQMIVWLMRPFPHFGRHSKQFDFDVTPCLMTSRSRKVHLACWMRIEWSNTFNSHMNANRFFA